MANVLSEKAVASLWVRHGGPVNQAAMAVAVCTAESGRNFDAVNPQSGATGGMQIHPGHPRYKDPDENMKVAVSKWKARGWQPWSVCGAGAWSAGEPGCPKLAGKANAVARRLKIPGPGGNMKFASDSFGLGDVLPWSDDFLDKKPGEKPDFIPDSINPIKGVEAVAGAVQDIFRLISAVLEKIADPNTWADALKIMAGLTLLYMGAKRTFELTK